MSLSNEHRKALRVIVEGANDMMQKYKPLGTKLAKSGQDMSSHHHLTLPLPQPITALFLARGFDSVAAEKFNQVYLDRAASLKQYIENQHRQAFEAVLNNPALDLDRLAFASRAAHVKRYDEDMARWRFKLDEISERYHPPTRASIPHTDDSPSEGKYATEKRAVFKNETVPLLEKAFTGNAYPSRTDKESLARETGMEYKQINIWFQNRRARSKKEGVPLRRTATFATQAHIPTYSTVSPSPEPHIAVNRKKERCTHSLENSCDLSTPITPFAQIARLAYTFPTPYPPLYDEDPFPVRSGAGSFTIPWLRKCSADLIQRPVVDIDQLTAKMGSLSLSSDLNTSHTSPSPFPSFMFILPRAPLPSLIRAAAASSCARPVASLVSAAGLSSASKGSKKLYRAASARLSIERSTNRSSSPVASSQSKPIPYGRTSAARRSRRSETRSPSPPYSSRSSSWSSTTSSRSSSSSWSAVSSTGPFTPSTSPRTEALSFTKDDTSSSTSVHYRHRSLSISDDVHSFC